MRMAALAAGTGIPPWRRVAAIPALGPASRRSSEGLVLTSSVPAAPAPVAPGAQPQMSSHNSRLAADSYKNCVWTISGEAPEFRARVPGGAPLRSLTRNRPGGLRAAHPATSQTPAVSAHAAVRWAADTRIPALRGESPSPRACVSFDRGPGSLEWPLLGLGAAPGWGNLLRQARGTPTPLSPPPAWASRDRQESGERERGPRPGGVSEPGSDCWTRGSPAPAIPAHAPAWVLSASLWLSRGRGAGGGGGGRGGRERWNAPPGHLSCPVSRAGSRRAGEAQG